MQRNKPPSSFIKVALKALCSVVISPSRVAQRMMEASLTASCLAFKEGKAPPAGSCAGGFQIRHNTVTCKLDYVKHNICIMHNLLQSLTLFQIKKNVLTPSIFVPNALIDYVVGYVFKSMLVTPPAIVASGAVACGLYERVPGGAALGHGMP